MPRRKRNPSTPERWPNEDEMEQIGWHTDQDFREARRGPVLHGRGINTPKIRVRASPSLQEGSYKSIGPVHFKATEDIVEDVMKALRRRPAAAEAVKEVMGAYGPYMGKYEVISVVTTLQKRQDWRRAFHVRATAVLDRVDICWPGKAREG
jgi:hypothetical protein